MMEEDEALMDDVLERSKERWQQDVAAKNVEATWRSLSVDAEQFLIERAAEKLGCHDRHYRGIGGVAQTKLKQLAAKPAA